MPKLSFLDQLNERQIEYADKIATKAKEMGIPPSLAIAIAYHESRLNPDVARGKNGEFGIMQVMPDTGKGMGFTNKDLNDPDKNIEAGLKYLKQNLDAFGGDPKMATVGYNAGTDSPFFSGGELPKVTEEYVKAMKGYGAYDEEAAPAPSGVEKAKQFLFGGSPPAVEETDAEREARMQSDVDAQEKRQAQLMGAAAGAGVSATRAAGSGVGAVIQAGANRAGQGLRAGMQGNVPPTPSAPPAAVPPGQSVMRQPIPSGGPDAGRLAPGQTGTMPYNYAKSAGLTDIEAGRALDMTKQSGGVHDLTTQRREGMNKIQQLFPGEKYVENPRFGGLLTLDEGGGKGPKQSFRVQGAIPAADLPPNFMPGPAAPPPQGTLVQLPPRQPVSTVPIAPKGPSGLDVVTNMFKSMMRPVASVVSTLGKYGLPPLALANAGGEGVNIMQQMRKPTDQMDTTGMALSGANILGSGLSMFPGTMAIGIPMTLGATAAQAYRDNPDYLRQKMQGAANIPLLEEMTGPLP